MKVHIIPPLPGSPTTILTTPAVLEWISIYWFSRAGPAASTRIYYEIGNGGTPSLITSPGWTSVPLGVSYFPAELIRAPKLYVFIDLMS